MTQSESKPKKTRKNTVSNYDLHKQCVFKDPDFVSEMESLSKLIIKQVGDYISIGENSTREIDEAGNKLLYIGFDIELDNNKFEALPKGLLLKFFAIAKEYYIEPSDIAHYLTMMLIMPNNMVPIAPKVRRVSIHEDTDGLYIRLDSPNASQADILEIWPEVEFRKESVYANYSPSKLKSTNNPELVYAIFKARQKGKTFKEIAELFNDDKLKGVKNNNSKKDDEVTVSEEQLTKLYSRYRPDR